MGIEPTSDAWEACNLTQQNAGLAAFLRFSERLNWKIMENENARRADRRSGFSWLQTVPGQTRTNRNDLCLLFNQVVHGLLDNFVRNADGIPRFIHPMKK